MREALRLVDDTLTMLFEAALDAQWLYDRHRFTSMT